jgi:hypothetical protein
MNVPEVLRRGGDPMLELEPMGSFVVYLAPDHSWRIPNGPLGARSTTQFREAVWESEHLNARSVWANGTYRAGPRVLEVEVRTMLQTHDEELIFFHYIGRADFESHSAGETPVISTGRVEAPEPGRYASLNDIQFVAKGMLDLTAGTQSYEIYALR